MKARHLTALGCLILLPLGVAVWLGLGTMERSDTERTMMLAELLTGRLERLRGQTLDLQQSFATRLRKLAGTAPAGLAVSGAAADDKAIQTWLRQVSLDDPLIRQAFTLDRNGSLTWPIAATASSQESAFLDRARTFLASTWLPPREERLGWPAEGGWYRWFWQDGLQVLYWLPTTAGFLCFDLNRSAVLAELATALEAPAIEKSAFKSNRVQLLDEQGRTFLQWGGWQATATPTTRLPLSGFLEGWELVWYLDPASLDEDSRSDLGLALSLIALCLAAAVLAAYFLRGWRRDLREAGQRVSFVNQVSHELKTPLTNIRLYAELLETRLEPEQTEAREYAAIIQREGRRLGRLIHNVLSFGRQERQGKPDALHPRPESPDSCVQACLEGFAISFQEKDMKLETDLACPGLWLFDPDVLDQILGNLLSNAEKYALSGQAVRVSTRPLAGSLEGIELEVRDWGPGLPPGAEKRVFGAFERFHTKLTDGVSGTGLGLYLVRQLARQHGGEAFYRPANPGASFIVRLAAEPRRDA